MRFFVNIIIIQFLFISSLFAQSNKKLDSLFNELKRPLDDTTEIKTLMNIASFYRYNNNSDSAVFYYLKAISKASETSQKKLISKCYNQLGNICYYKSSYDTALFYYLKSLQVDEEINDLNSISISYNNIGNIYSEKGDYRLSIEYYTKSLEISRDLNNKVGIARCYINIGGDYYSLGSFEKALDSYFQSLKIAEELNDKKLQSASYVNIGLIYSYQKNYKKSLIYYNKALDIDKEIGDEIGVSICNINISSAYDYLKDFDKSIEYSNKALEIYEKYNNKDGISACFGNMASAFKNKGQFVKAYNFYYKSLKLKQEIGDLNGISNVYYNIAELDLLLKKSMDAIHNGEKALEIAIKIKALPRQQSASKVLVAAYKKNGEYQKALEYQQFYQLVNDSIINLETNKKLIQIEALYQIEKNQLEIENLRNEKALNEIELKRQRFIRNTFIWGFIIMLILVLIILINRKKLKKAHHQLEINQKIILLKNLELKQQKEEIEVQRNNLEEFNRLLEDKVQEELLKNREKDLMMIHQSRHAAMGEMISNIAHQWRQPLNSVGVLIQNILDAFEYGEVNKEYLQKKVAKGMALLSHMSNTIDDFKDFFKPNKEKVEFNVSQVIIKSISFIEESFKNYDIIIEQELDSELCLEGYPNELIQVMLNILNNAKDALVEKRKENRLIRVRLEKVDNSIIIKISDNAGGIPQEILGKIFDSYFTTKDEDKGTGLGLYMSKNIIEKNMNGSINVYNSDFGAVFEIKI